MITLGASPAGGRPSIWGAPRATVAAAPVARTSSSTVRPAKRDRSTRRGSHVPTGFHRRSHSVSQAPPSGRARTATVTGAVSGWTWSEKRKLPWSGTAVRNDQASGVRSSTLGRRSRLTSTSERGPSGRHNTLSAGGRPGSRSTVKRAAATANDARVILPGEGRCTRVPIIGCLAAPKDLLALQNLFGIEVAALDVVSFLAAAHRLYPLLAVAWLLVVWRRRRSSWLLAGVLLANLFAWFVTTYPLPRLYALGVGRDRLSNLAFCQVAAATGSPLETWQVGQSHLDRQGRPHHVFWSLLVAALSGFDPRRVPVVYAWLPLAVLWAFVLALELALRPPRWGVRGVAGFTPATQDAVWSGWERALVAGGATLLCAAPMDFISPYGPAWSMTFLLKPNHALGLVVFPLVLRSCARSRGWRGWLASALLLHLLGWVFALHVVYVACGLLVFAALTWLRPPRAEAGLELRSALVPLAINAAVTGPVILLLILDRLKRPASVHSLLPSGSPHLLEATLRAGPVFALALWGAWSLIAAGTASAGSSRPNCWARSSSGSPMPAWHRWGSWSSPTRSPTGCG